MNCGYVSSLQFPKALQFNRPLRLLSGKMYLLVSKSGPEDVVNARRRTARKNAKKKGYTPSHAHLTLLAWNLFITNVPETIWQTTTVLKVYPIRWQVEL